MKHKFITILIVLISSCQQDLPLVAIAECETVNPRFAKAVILVLGQSNAANWSNKKITSTCSNTYNFYKGELSHLQDPLNGANGSGGSVWTPMTMQLMEANFAQEIIIVPTAIGGSSVQQWVPGGNLHYLLEQTIDELNATSIVVSHILWHQGESNNTILNPNLSAADNAAQYQTDLTTLINYLRSRAIQAPFFVATATRCGNLTPDTALQNAQQTIVNDSLKIYLGPNTDLLGEEYRYDRCHFNEIGIEKHAEMWTKILMEHP